MKRSRFFAYLAAAAGLSAATMFVASPANAATIDTNCSYVAGHCIYWGQNYDGSHSNVEGTVYNFPVSGTTSYKFLTAGSGQGQYIGNNNGSDWNFHLNCDVVLWYNPASGTTFSGPSVTIVPGEGKAGSGLGMLLNNIRGQSWGYCRQS